MNEDYRKLIHELGNMVHILQAGKDADKVRYLLYEMNLEIQKTLFKTKREGEIFPF